MNQAAYERLAQVLAELAETHERILHTVREHRAALARADTGGMSAAIARHGDLARRVGMLEQTRAQIAAELAPRGVAAPASAPEARLSGLIEQAPPTLRDKLVGLRSVLRDVLERLSAEQRALRLAAGELAGHMEGVMRQIHQRAAHAGTYVRNGRIDTAARVVSAIDIRT